MTAQQHKGETCVLAYSGGLDTSVAVAWLRETHGFEVVTCTGDLGSVRDLDAIQKKAIASGARKAIVQDARDIFVRFFVWPALQAGALYEERYPLATALGRPLLAKLLVDVARDENARFVAHGCTGKGNDQVRFDLAVGALAPDLKVIASLDTARAKTLVDDGTIEGGMVPKVEACLLAASAGCRAAIVAARGADAIEKLLTGEQVGTVFEAAA